MIWLLVSPTLPTIRAYVITALARTLIPTMIRSK